MAGSIEVRNTSEDTASQQGTWGWWDECVDEVYALLPPEAQKHGFAPGFDIAQLEADLNLVADGGGVPGATTGPTVRKRRR